MLLNIINPIGTIAMAWNRHIILTRIARVNCVSCLSVACLALIWGYHRIIRTFVPHLLSFKMQVNTDLSMDSGVFAQLMLFSRSSTRVTGGIRGYWLRRGVHWSASSLRLLLLLYLSGGSSVAELQSWLGRSSMPMCYVKVSEGLVCRYGRGKGKLACYRLTRHGEEFVESFMALVHQMIADELNGLPKKARIRLNMRAK